MGKVRTSQVRACDGASDRATLAPMTSPLSTAIEAMRSHFSVRTRGGEKPWREGASRASRDGRRNRRMGRELRRRSATTPRPRVPQGGGIVKRERPRNLSDSLPSPPSPRELTQFDGYGAHLTVRTGEAPVRLQAQFAISPR